MSNSATLIVTYQLKCKAGAIKVRLKKKNPKYMT